MCSTGVIPSNEEPTQTARIAPDRYWPWPPMLKRPQRKANATARPVRMSGVACTMVAIRLISASCPLTPNGLPGMNWNGQSSPAPTHRAL